MNWSVANRVAHLAATKAHSRLGVDAAKYPVNVSQAIDNAGLALMRRPMPRLFGVYIEANGNRGVMVNSIMTRATRRQTAAHELGHHEFGHRPDPARQCALDGPEFGYAAGGVPLAGGRGRVHAEDQMEMSAEAFAAWFLMPRRAVLAALADLGIERVSSAAEVYQLSLLLGTAYRATCRHLVNIRMATRDDSEAWARIQPARLKRALAAEVGLKLSSTFDMDVWDLRRASGIRLEASVGDVLVVPANVGAVVQAAGLELVASDASTLAAECVREIPRMQFTEANWSMSLVVHGRPVGLYVAGADPSLGNGS